MIIKVGFYVVNASRHTFVEWYDTDTLPPLTELPHDFACTTDHLQLVLINQKDCTYYGLPYRTTSVQVLAEIAAPPIFAYKVQDDYTAKIKYEYHQGTEVLFNAKDWQLPELPNE